MPISYYHINQSLKKIQLLRHRYLHQQMGTLNVHPSQLPILEYVNRNPGCTQVDISENLALTPGAVALATKRLQHEGLLEKRADENNLRCNVLTLTPEGKRLCMETKGIFDSFDAIMYKGMETDELEWFQQCLDRITMNITGEKTNPVNPKIISSLMQEVRRPQPECSERGSLNEK